jgi:hypothetical protein
MQLADSCTRSAIVFGSGLFLIIIFLVQGISFIRANSPTYDEGTHLAAGYSYLATRDFRLDSEHPPLIKEIQALPLFLIYRLPFNPDPEHWREKSGFLSGQDFLYKSALSADRMLMLARLPNLFLGASLIALIGWWAYRLWSTRAALLAMAVACLDPNLVAHSSVVTDDIGVTLFIFLTVYLLWEYVNASTWWLLAATGLSTGAALVSKFSGLLLVPLIPLVIAFAILTDGKAAVLLPAKRTHKPRHKFLGSAAVLFFILFFAALTIPAAYFFQGFQHWLSGFGLLLSLTPDGRAAFFLGQYSYEGWWSYFLVAFLIKTPIGSLALILASLALYKFGSPLGWREAAFLLVPVIVFFGVATQSKVAIGLRYILPVYPFLFVLASRLATVRSRNGWAQLLISVPVLLTAISSFRIGPHQLAYFNEFVGGPEQGYRYLSDSNLDWGQDLKGVKAYMDKENLPVIYLSYFGTAPPSYYGIRYQYVPGTWPLEWPLAADATPTRAARKILAISVYNLQDVAFPYDPLFRWLWTRTPIAKIGYSIFVYDLTDEG